MTAENREEKRKKERKIDRNKKAQDKNIMSASDTQGGHKQKSVNVVWK